MPNSGRVITADPKEPHPDASYLATLRGSVIDTYLANSPQSFVPMNIVAPLLTAPAPGATITSTIAFAWVPRLQLRPEYYELQLGRLQNDGSVQRLWSDVIDPAALHYQLDLEQLGEVIPGDTYVWRVSIIEPSVSQIPGSSPNLESYTYWTGPFTITNQITRAGTLHLTSP
jgi:hypothetical protein